MHGLRATLATALAASLLVPGAALADEQADTASTPEPATQPAPAEPTPPAEPDAGAPTAQPAQDDVSGGDQYTEDTPPTAPAPEPPPTDEPSDPAPTEPSPSAPTGSAPTATTAAETADTGAADTLPRTGAEGLIVGLIGLTLLGCGTLLRRAARFN